MSATVPAKDNPVYQLADRLTDEQLACESLARCQAGNRVNMAH